ncbi:MAG: phenylalanine--tRNA ligase subunit beta, partial [Cyanobacteria bacterium]|nr:phenylalanine--tRNA ligase subunit beta [Cyanobacteriota bacterium]
MLVSLEWLGQYVNLQGLTPEAIAEALTHAGLEVESIQRTGASFSGVVVGKIQTIEKHPNADKLRLVTVLLGESQDPEAESSQETAKVVCGAPNVREGILIPFAKLGATVLNRKDGTTFVLEAAKIRGVESSGMICSLEELGLETFYPKPEDGIWPLDDHLTDENIGQDLVKALKIESDALLETAPTANRGDLMSMMGVAREIAALFDRELHLPEFRQPSHPSGVLKMGIKIESPEVCHYYAGASLRNLKIGPSPEWLVKRLAAVGIRTINNVVDITNYVMIETGQPLHAFDQDKLAYTLEIGVRRGTPGETLKTLDGIERTLSSESVVITNNNHPINTIALHPKNVILFSLL